MLMKKKAARNRRSWLNRLGGCSKMEGSHAKIG
jgi:hypothetical protein